MYSMRRMLVHPSTETMPGFRTNPTSHPSSSTSLINNTDALEQTIPTLQELTGDFIRKRVEEERKSIIRKHSDIFDSKRFKLDLRRQELQQQLEEVEEKMETIEIDCHKEMLTELDQFDSERQPEMLDLLTDVGQLDRICSLCEKYFRSSTVFPGCCLGRDRCHQHTVQRCCFSCSRLSFYDIVQCLAQNEDKGKRNDDDERELLEIENDLETLEAAASTPSWMLEEIFGEGAGLTGQNNEDEYQEPVATIAAEVVRLVPSESGIITCPVCHKHYCDHDFLYHFAACRRQVFVDDQEIFTCFECSE